MPSVVASIPYAEVIAPQSQQADPAELLRRQCWPSVAKAGHERLRPLRLPSAVATLGFNMEDVREVFARLAGDPAIKKRPYLRTYVDGQLVPSLERKIWQSPIDEQSSFDAWFKRVFEHERSGLILNGAERWALGASQKVARWLQPKIEEADPLRLCLEIVLFAGDYGFTPFGVHRDEPCASVIHFNLGPNAKDIYIFEHEGAQGNPPSIQDATRYCVAPGDGFVLPANYAHIGDAAAFSVDISCKLMFRDDEAALALATAHLHDGKGDVPGADLEELLLRRLGAAGRDEPVGATVEHWMTAARLRARSNSLFVGTPIEAEVLWAEDSVLSANNWFPVVLHESDGRLTLFSRGKSLTLTGGDNLRAAMQDLRDGRQMQVRELLQRCGSSLTSRALVDFLVASRGVAVSS